MQNWYPNDAANWGPSPTSSQQSRLSQHALACRDLVPSIGGAHGTAKAAGSRWGRKAIGVGTVHA